MKTARKVLTLALCAILLVSATIMGTMAYLTSTDTVNNTFTVGKVEIKLDEAKANADGTLVEGAGRVKANSYKLMPGHTYNKDPMVTVKAGSEESYIRMIVTINKKAELDAIGFNTLEVFAGYDENNWPLASQKADGDSMVYEFRYKNTVNTLTGEELELDALFDQVVVPDTIDNAQLATLEGLQINVVAQAIQADGFATADDAWAQWK